MPELPEVETTCRGLVPHIINNSVQEVLIRNNKLRWPVPEELPTLLLNGTCLSVIRRAKYILLKFTHGTLIIHLGMSGSLRICESSTPFLKHEHVQFAFVNGITLRYHDPRRFGCILWSNDNLTHPLLKKLGMEPLAEEFNASFLFNLIKNKNIGIKKLLMDAKHIVGIGNIYACEALFYAKIHPSRPAKNLDLADCEKLVGTIKNVLNKAIETGGTTLRDFVNSDGKPGYFTQQLAVYGRNSQKCKLCDSTIEMITIAQRRSDYCPTCQSF
jgi:formamidopyrimidine-DNA glycosylase